MENFVSLWRRLAIIFGLSLVLVACQTVKVVPPGPSLFQTYTITDIDFNFQNVQEPMHVASIETAYRKSKLGTSELSHLGQRFTRQYREGKRQALYQSIEDQMKPHVISQFTSKFQGQQPAKLTINIKNVFIRSRLNLSALTGLDLTLNGAPGPGQSQLIASATISKQESGLSVKMIDDIKITDDGSIAVFSGKKLPNYGVSKRLNKMAREWAKRIAQKLEREAPWTGFSGAQYPHIRH